MALAAGSPVLAVLWAQWRSLLNLRTGERLAGRLLATALAVLWYSLWALLAVGAALLLSRPRQAELASLIPWGLMLVMLYWQMAPIVTASLGASLDLKKLLVYPVPEGKLFLAEVLLRLTTGLEMMLVLGGVAVGLLRNPAVPGWAPLLALPLYALFNLLTAAGLRSLLERLLARRRLREAAVFLLVLGAAAPQVLLLAGVPAFLRELPLRAPPVYWPWVSFGNLAVGRFGPQDWVLAALWSTAAYLFGRWQFRRSLHLDRTAVEVAEAPAPQTLAAGRRGFAVLGRLLPDPLGAIVEKELRSLARSPRFRLVFLMGFSFGFLIWAPLMHRQGEGFSGNYPVLVSLYALVLLSEVIFWNMFGFDRAAVQIWFSAPAPFRSVLKGKNLAGAILAAAEASVVLAVCALLGLRAPVLKILEVYAVTLTFCLYLLAAGNFSSLYFPRPVNPEQSWGRASAGRFQILLLLLYPVLGAPLALAYLGRYAFQSEGVFFGLLAGAATLGVVFYRISLDSALRLAERRRERMIEALAQGGGPILTQ